MGDNETQDYIAAGNGIMAQIQETPVNNIQPLSSEDADRILGEILGNQRAISTEEVEHAMAELDEEDFLDGLEDTDASASTHSSSVSYSGETTTVPLTSSQQPNPFADIAELRNQTKARVLQRRACDVSNYLTSFSGASWFEEIMQKEITLIGCGGIGSHTAFLLARSGIKSLFVIDGDTVEPRNISGQLFRVSDVGVHKTEALHNIITQLTSFNGLSTAPSYINVEGQHLDNIASTRIDMDSIPFGEITICGLDNMGVRKAVFNKWKEKFHNNPFGKWFIDGRLSLDTLQIFTIKNNDEYAIETYEKEYLFSDADADPTTCSTKQTSFMASMIGSLITNVVVAISSLSAHTGYSREDADMNMLKAMIPFKIEYDSNLFNMSIKR